MCPFTLVSYLKIKKKLGAVPSLSSLHNTVVKVIYEQLKIKYEERRFLILSRTNTCSLLRQYIFNS